MYLSARLMVSISCDRNSWP